MHLRVAVLVDDVHALMGGDELVHLAGERKRLQPQVVGFDAVLVLQLVERLGQSVMRGAVGDDADFVAFIAEHLGPRHQRARVFELALQAIEIVHVIVGALTVLRLLVVSAAAREPCGCGMVGSRQGAIANAVAIKIFVAGEASQAARGLLSTAPCRD